MDAVWINEDGRFDTASLVRAVREGRIGQSTMLIRHGDAQAAPAGNVLPLLFASPPAPGPLPARLDWSDTGPHPWRRFAARLVDIGLIGGLSLMLLVGTFALFQPDEGQAALRFLNTKVGTLVAGAVETLLMIPLNAIALAQCGSTPGKALFGIRLRQGGHRPDFRTLLRREMSVVGRGQALGLPLLDLAAMAIAYRHLQREGRTTWDEIHGLTVHHRPTTWGMSAWLVILLLFLLAGYTALLPI